MKVLRTSEIEPKERGGGLFKGRVTVQPVLDAEGSALRTNLINFDEGAVAKLSNQYAAMPSMHTGWSTWCALVLIPMTRRRWLKVVIGLYPVATVFCIMVTGNHYWLDAVGGLAALGGGWLIGSNLTAFTERWHQKRAHPVPA